MPFDREDALKRAEKFLRLGRLDAAIAEYQRVVDEVPSDWKTLNALADLYLRANQPARATTLFARIADHLAAEGFSARAEAFYKRILKVQPHDERALDALAGLAIRQGILVEAKTHLLALARARQARGDRRGAAEALLRVNTLDPADFGARREAARTAAQGGNNDLAATELASIARDLVADGRRAEAVELLQEGIALVPEDRTLRDRLMEYAIEARTFEPLIASIDSAADCLALSDRLAAAGWVEGAARALEEASVHDVDDPVASRLFAHHLDRRNLESARRFARTTSAWLALSAACEESGDLTAAESAVEEALRLEPESREARTRAARLHTGRGDHEGALEHLGGLGHTDDTDLHLMAVESGLRSGHHEEALRRLATLLDDGRVSDVQAAAFATTLVSSDPAAAWLALELLVDRLVDAANPVSAAGYLRGFAGRYPKHVGALTKLVEVSVDIGSEEELTEAQASLAEAYLAVGSGAEARIIAEDLVSRSPHDLRRQDCLRRALALVGELDPEQAVKDFAGRAAALGASVDASVLEEDPAVAAGPDVPDTGRARDLFELGPAAVDLSDFLNEILAHEDDTARADAAQSESPEVDLTEVLKELRPATVRAGTGSQKGSKMSDKPERSNLDEVFRDFREEVSRQSAADEAEQHYKVALTYRDMGMLDDAVRELEQAARAPKLRFEAASLLARLLRDRGDAPTAIDWFERAAEAPAPTPEAGRALLYELGQALETCGEVARALAVYLELQADAGEYGDLRARVERLSRVQAES